MSTAKDHLASVPQATQRSSSYAKVGWITLEHSLPKQKIENKKFKNNELIINNLQKALSVAEFRP